MFERCQVHQVTRGEFAPCDQAAMRLRCVCALHAAILHLRLFEAGNHQGTWVVDFPSGLKVKRRCSADVLAHDLIGREPDGEFTLAEGAARHWLELRSAGRLVAVVRLAALTLLLLCAACGGDPFEAAHPTASGGISAQSGAASATGGGSLSFGGVAAGGMHASAGGSKGGETSSSSSGESGAGGAAGAAVDVAGGDAGAAGAAGAPTESPPKRCDVSGWSATAFASGAATTPELMFDGDEQTRWTSGIEQAAGQWIEIKFGAGVQLVELELESKEAPKDLPSAVRVSFDGREVASSAQVVAGVLRIKFAETQAVGARVTLTSPSLNWWSVAELGGLCK